MAIVSRWRQHSIYVIEQTLAKLPRDADLATVKKALQDAYPFGERAMHPYDIWLSVQREALALRFPEVRKKLAAAAAARFNGVLAASGQMALFEVEGK